MPGGARNSRGYYAHDDVNDDGNHGQPSHDWVDTVESRFPSAAMYYQSDAQRSDTATVCSGSVIEDIEVESVLSQEDAIPPGKPMATVGSGNVGSADRMQTQRDESHLSEYVDTENADHHSMMGPPLNRTLLLQQEYATMSSTLPSHSLKSYGSGSETGGTRSAHYSDDCESNHSKDDEPSMLRDGMTESTLRFKDHGDATRTPERGGVSFPARADSVKSYGSGSAADTDDCGGSLDVETHSVGTRSIHSQDDGLPPAAPLSEPESETAVPTLSSAPVENGRRSPGGTIYKGRGIRRYQGRYMHLPLKRFHQNGVHLDENDDHDYERQLPNHVEHLDNHDLPGGFNDDHEGRLYPDWQDPRREPERPGRSRRPAEDIHSTSRRRSRSRSPTHRDDDYVDDEDDRKPRARR